MVSEINPFCNRNLSRPGTPPVPLAFPLALRLMALVLMALVLMALVLMALVLMALVLMVRFAQFPLTGEF